MKSKSAEHLAMLIIGGFLLIIILSIVSFAAYMEARQFNKFSTQKISWFDALWADYRIIPK